MSDKRRHNRSYLLRLWLTESTEGLIWRASLEDVRGGERCGFANLSSLFAFLEDQTRDDLEHDKDREAKDEG